MPVWKQITDWLGITLPDWKSAAIARRNMPIVAVGSIVVGLFAAMLAFCLLTGTPCTVEGFDEAAYANPGVLFRYTVTSSVITVLMFVICGLSVLYMRKKWERPAFATAMTIVFVFFMAVLWGIADSGCTADRQILIFASIEFLVAGLIVFKPIVSLVYFAATFMVFSTALNLSGQFNDIALHDLAYLAFLDIVVCWVVYGLFLRSIERQKLVSDMSQRDELTGARNRHCLREDFPGYIGSDVRVVLCDIDNFKHYNDDYDHEVGDDLLKQFYTALCDAFGEQGVYRYGGDEFLLVLKDDTCAEFSQEVEKVRAELAAVQIEGESTGLTFSGGYVCGKATDNLAFRDMLHEADENLIEAKRAGKNRVVGL